MTAGNRKRPARPHVIPAPVPEPESAWIYARMMLLMGAIVVGAVLIGDAAALAALREWLGVDS